MKEGREKKKKKNHQTKQKKPLPCKLQQRELVNILQCQIQTRGVSQNPPLACCSRSARPAMINIAVCTLHKPHQLRRARSLRALPCVSSTAPAAPPGLSWHLDQLQRARAVPGGSSQMQEHKRVHGTGAISRRLCWAVFLWGGGEVLSSSFFLTLGDAEAKSRTFH